MTEIRKTAHFDKWFADLRDRKARAAVLARITRLGEGNPGQHRNLTDGVSELKIDIGPGYRVYYTRRGNVLIIVLCGGDKRTQDADIKLAIKFAREL
jgi:putative addiction module killer protein